MEVDFVEQSKRYGLGHAIWTGKETYKDNEPLIIILGDTVFDVNLDKIFQVNKNAIGVKEVEDPRRFGVVVINKQNKIEKFIEKPLNPVSNLAIVGMYYIQSSQELINSLEYIINNNIQTKGEFQLTDALQHMLESNISFTTFNVEGWYDCGKAETLISTNKFLLDKHFSEIQVNNGNNVIIPPCFISKDAIVENSIVDHILCCRWCCN